MVLAVVYYAWTPVRMWCCRRRVPGSVDAAVEERLKRLEGNAQPVSFLFLPRCFIFACQFSLYLPTCLLPTCLLVYWSTSYFLSTGCFFSTSTRG